MTDLKDLLGKDDSNMDGAVGGAAKELLDAMKTSSAPNFLQSAIDRISFEIPPMPTHEEVHEYQSAEVFMRSLADEALHWKATIEDGYRTAIIAILHGGIQIDVHSLAQISFHGIRIVGTLNGSPCSLLAHQATVQMLCYAEEIKPDEKRNPIGFIWRDEERTEI